MALLCIIVALAILCPLVAVTLFPAPDIEMRSDEYDIHGINEVEEYLESVSPSDLT